MSIKEIAEALNLSKATVSWILSGQGEKKGFSEKTIKRVKDYADSVNYSPNLIARSLSLGTSNTIGLIIPFIDDTFYAQLTMAIEREAIKNKYMLFVCSSEGNGEKEFELMKALRSKQVDGLIIAPNNLSRDGIDYLKKESFPFVLVDRYYPSIPSNYVVVNNKEGCYDLVKRLAASGAHKIALVTTDVHLYVMKQRIEGYCQALTDAGCERLVSLELLSTEPIIRQILSKNWMVCLLKCPMWMDFSLLPIIWLWKLSVISSVKRSISIPVFRWDVSMIPQRLIFWLLRWLYPGCLLPRWAKRV